MSKQKTKKFRGSRTCGGGTSKNRRGAGNRGGRGNAGTCKHHFVRALQRDIYFGKHGFKRPAVVSVDLSIANVGEIDEAIEQLVIDGIAQKQGDSYHLTLASIGIEKVLGSGKVTKSLVLTADEFSESAKQKIEDANGKTIVTSVSAEE